MYTDDANILLELSAELFKLSNKLKPSRRRLKSHRRASCSVAHAGRVYTYSRTTASSFQLHALTSTYVASGGNSLSIHRVTGPGAGPHRVKLRPGLA